MASSDLLRERQSVAGGDDRPVVLVVDDHRELTDLYEVWLDDRYDLRAAGDGDSALGLLAGEDDPDSEGVTAGVEAVLLDRRLRGECGTELLAGLRAVAPDVAVAFVSVLEPDLDVAAARPDAYLEKPVSRRDLRVAVEYLLALRSLEEPTRRVLAARATVRAVEAAVPTAVRDRSHAYRRLLADCRADDAGPGDESDPGEAVAAAVDWSAGGGGLDSGFETRTRFYHGCPRTTGETRGTRA